MSNNNSGDSKAAEAIIKVGNMPVPVAIQSTSLAMILGVGAMVYSNFGSLQDKVSDSSSRQVVIEQQLEAVKKQLEVIDSVIERQDVQQTQQSEMAARMGLFEMRLEMLEVGVGRKKKGG